jgi:hypothetical protein
MAKRATKKSASTSATKTAKRTVKKATRSTTQRDLIRHGSRSAYAKRTPAGEFTELDDVGRSQTADRRVKAKRVVRSGFGDQGDQAPDASTGTSRSTRKVTAKRTAKKR